MIFIITNQTTKICLFHSFNFQFITHFVKQQQALNFTCGLLLLIYAWFFQKAGLIIFEISNLIVYLMTYSQIVISKKLELAHLNFA